MTRRLLAATAATLALCAGLTGCGIPAQTDVQVDGDGRGASPFPGSVGDQSSAPPSRTDTEDPSRFVTNYLEAAAGETAGAYDRVRAYIAPDARNELLPKTPGEVGVTIVRPAENAVLDPVLGGDGNWRVSVPIQQVGVLRPNGTIGPPMANAPASYTFKVGKVAANGPGKTEAGLYLLDAPRVLLMSTEALSRYYLQYTIYFWSSDGGGLVPDQRYLAAAVPSERRPTEVAGWLNGGPAEWIRPAARSLPDGVRVTGNVAENDGKLDINLSPPNGPVDEEAELDRLATQLAWSLPGPRQDFELYLRNQRRRTIDVSAQRAAAPVYPLVDEAQRFCVFDGEVHPLVTPGAEPATVPIKAEANRNVVSAGLIRSGPEIAVALVTTAGGRQRLLTGHGAGEVNPTARSSASFGSMSRPVWLKGPDPAREAGLVVADGRLYRFDTSARLTEVRLPDAPGSVTAVGAALDGRRVALISGGKVYVAVLSSDGGSATLGVGHQVFTSLSAPTAVDWTGEGILVVAGTDARRRPTLYQVSVEAAVETPLRETGAPVTHLAAYPDNPVVGFEVSRVMYEASGVAWADRLSVFEQITPERVAGSGASPGNAGNPRAPFFLY